MKTPIVHGLIDALRIAERFMDTINAPGCVGNDHCNCQRCCALRVAREAIKQGEQAIASDLAEYGHWTPPVTI